MKRENMRTTGGLSLPEPCLKALTIAFKAKFIVGPNHVISCLVIALNGPAFKALGLLVVLNAIELNELIGLMDLRVLEFLLLGAIKLNVLRAYI